MDSPERKGPEMRTILEVLAQAGFKRTRPREVIAASVAQKLALDLLWMALSFSWNLFELGPALLLVLNGVILSLFLEPTVARAMVVKQRR